MIKGIVFDLDQTLVDRCSTFRLFIGDQFERFADSFAPYSRDDYWKSIRRFDDNGYSEKSEMFSSACNDLDIGIDPEVLCADFKENYGKHPVLFDGALAVLDALKPKFRLGLVSNGRSIGQRAKLKHSGLEKYFEVVKISEEEGVAKPDHRIFERCLKDLGLKANQCVYIGDHPTNDVSAARACGMKGIWVKSSHYMAPEKNDGIIESLSDLLDLID